VKRRVLHIISGMNRGGVETWIMNVLRRIDTQRIQFDFLVETAEPADYDAEILASGGQILRSPLFRRRGRAAARLAEVLRRHGPYDVVHAHGRHNMALPLSVAAAMRVPVRIGHVHNMTDSHDQDRVQRAYKRAMKQLLLGSATWILGCSTAALESLYGQDATRAHRKLAMLPYGIDMAAFAPRPRPDALLRDLDIPPGARIAGHVGRFVWEKNHAFLIEIFAQLARRDPAWRLLMVGDGRLRGEIEQAVAAAGLGDRVRFAGVRTDVPDLMAAMDVFVFPSAIEGFGLVLVEAQALGLPCVLGQHLPGDVDVNAQLIHRVSLDAGASAWADAAERAASAPRRDDQAHAIVASSRFNIERSVELLLTRYYNFGHAG
jgi:glycosyltransferase involved in cell wall biosynthesis